MKTQCDMVLDYMKEFGSITTMEAFRDIGVTRLSARISDLRFRGYKIKKEPETVKTRYGKTTTVARYRFKDNG